MRGRGINYDTGAFPAGKSTREHFDPDVVRREMQIIARDLHCTAVRISGGDPARLTIAGEHAADTGLEVWFAPFPCELTTEEMLPYFADCAVRAEDIRRRGADVVLVTGGEISLFTRGFIPGDDLLSRIAVLMSPTPQLRDTLSEIPARVNAFLAQVTTTVRQSFGGKVTYASLPFEQVDWNPFDYVAVDAYRAAHNIDSYREELRGYRRHDRPVVVTEFGCCTYQGAADRGARGWLIVDRDAETRQLDGTYVRDEAEQAAYLQDLLQIFEEEDIDSAFWYTFAGYNFPHHSAPRRDLDMASYGVVKLTGRAGTVYPHMNWEPKASFHALAAAYDKKTASDFK
jgi:hypothetical protein